jgi:hypothetical protein
LYQFAIQITESLHPGVRQTANQRNAAKADMGFAASEYKSIWEDLKLRNEIAKVESKEMRDRVMQLTNPWIEAGKREGLQQGRHEGEAELVLKQLARRLGDLSAAREKSIRKLPLSKIEELGEALLDFRSRRDLVHWLRLNSWRSVNARRRGPACLIADIIGVK